MIFYNDGGEELERLDISEMTRKDLNKLMKVKGFEMTKEWDKKKEEL